MFPCEMARYIAGFPAEARKSGPLRWSSSRSYPGLGSDRSRFSISEHSAGISWPRPVPPGAAAELDAAADARLEVPRAAAAADARLGVPDAAVGPPEGVVAAPVLLSAASGVVAAVVKPDAAVQGVEPAGQTLQALPRVSPAKKRPLVFAPFQAFSGHAGLRRRTPAPSATWPGWSQICFQGSASHSGWSRSEPVPSLSAFSASRQLRYQAPVQPAMSSSGSSPICGRGQVWHPGWLRPERDPSYPARPPCSPRYPFPFEQEAQLRSGSPEGRYLASGSSFPAPVCPAGFLSPAGRPLLVASWFSVAGSRSAVWSPSLAAVASSWWTWTSR
jgi:hypothetical protein